MRLIYLVLASIFTVLTKALGTLGINEISSVGASCVYIANNFTSYPFNCKGHDIDYACRCSDLAFLGTVLICIDDNSDSPLLITNAYNYLIDFCKLQAHISYTLTGLAKIFNNATKYAIYPNDTTVNNVLLNPVLPNEPLFKVSSDSVERLLSHRVISTLFGGGLLSYWLTIVLIGLMNNMGVWCVPSGIQKMNGTVSKWIQRHLINPHLFSRNTNKERKSFLGKLVSVFVRTLPTRLESLIIMGYFILIIILCCIDYNLHYPNTIFIYKSCGKLVYIADRTGIISITQLPLLFLFAGRNNFLIIVTGWSYRAFNIYHKWIARFVWILILIHGCCYTAYSKQNNDYSARWSLEKWRWANTATICSGVMIILSFRAIRKIFYELFKVSHQALAIIFLIGCWNHCKTLGWMEFIYAAVAIWAFEHMIRLSKIFISGGVVIANCQAIIDCEYDVNKEKQENEDGVKHDTEDGCHTTQKAKKSNCNNRQENEVHSIRVNISHSGWWRVYPGCYVFLYFLKPAFFWQSHPFTIVESSSEETNDQLTMIIRVKDGLTKRLADFLCNMESFSVRIPVLVEGPYGTPIAFRNYQNALFIAAGVGMTISYTLAVDLARQYKAEVLRGNYKEEEHKIIIVWMTPRIGYVETFLSEVESLGKISGICFSIYITRDDEEQMVERLDNDDLSSTYQRIKNITANNIPGIQVSLGERPHLKNLVVEELNKIEGNTAVIACGPDSVNRDVRAATGKWHKYNNLNTHKVDYFEEELLW
ncbi:hypothetical protein DASC09_000820 [Saccharomycopsis crataegensis]|uniref:FAD-binding FR-type domain-containing protein n=1 Tax=Saccharomycopsis crataegensis TaxID=43959 RepID=A0AAV5QDD2_9ASCO|nr:hypothetical protein DASC09_000820 [Saccharomycopsis crataegensis]